MRDLCARSTNTKALSEFHPKLKGGLARLGKQFGSHDRADAKLDLFEIIPCNHGGNFNNFAQ